MNETDLKEILGYDVEEIKEIIACAVKKISEIIKKIYDYLKAFFDVAMLGYYIEHDLI